MALAVVKCSAPDSAELKYNQVSRVSVLIGSCALGEEPSFRDTTTTASFSQKLNNFFTLSCSSLPWGWQHRCSSLQTWSLNGQLCYTNFGPMQQNKHLPVHPVSHHLLQLATNILFFSRFLLTRRKNCHCLRASSNLRWEKLLRRATRDFGLYFSGSLIRFHLVWEIKDFHTRRVKVTSRTDQTYMRYTAIC